MSLRFRLLVLLLACISLVPAIAHEVRPALLQITETVDGRFDVLWKQPRLGETVVHIVPHVSGGLLDHEPASVASMADAEVTVWKNVSGVLDGQTISIEGLDHTITDVLVSVRRANGDRISAVLRPDSSSFTLEGRKLGLPVLGYFKLGVEHILTGVDHLMFVLGLLLLLRGSWWTLLKTVTAFTVAHSLTLALVTLGLIHPSPPIVEALVALSIVFVAVEVTRSYRGAHGLTIQYPWIIAFVFGLLHGTAFASGLMEIGLPPDDIPLALLLFNLGIEAGQLLFIAAVLGVVGLIGQLPRSLPDWSRWITPYVIGTCAAYWFFERIDAALHYTIGA